MLQNYDDIIWFLRSKMMASLTNYLRSKVRCQVYVEYVERDEMLLVKFRGAETKYTYFHKGLDDDIVAGVSSYKLGNEILREYRKVIMNAYFK